MEEINISQSGKLAIHRVEPGVDSSFARVDFLSATNQADDRRPNPGVGPCRRSGTPARTGESGPLLFAQHEVGGLLLVPRALRFIENHDVFDWRAGIDQRVIAEMVHILNERLHAFPNFAFADSFRRAASDVRLRPASVLREARRPVGRCRKERQRASVSISRRGASRRSGRPKSCRHRERP